MSTINKKRKVPWFWRKRFSCPDCGRTEKQVGEFLYIIEKERQFKCPRCNALYGTHDFYEENYFKNGWSADLSQE